MLSTTGSWNSSVAAKALTRGVYSLDWRHTQDRMPFHIETSSPALVSSGDRWYPKSFLPDVFAAAKTAQAIS
jgi:hypothetical protein